MVGGASQPYTHPLNPVPQLTTVSNPNKFSSTAHALLFNPFTLALKTHPVTPTPFKGFRSRPARRARRKPLAERTDGLCRYASLS
jgi:hypothetical protein